MALTKSECIFVSKYRAYIAQGVSIGFNTLKVRGRLATKKSCNSNINQPLLRIIRIRTYYFTIQKIDTASNTQYIDAKDLIKGIRNKEGH